MPFEDLTGSSGFTSDSEGASASLDITMSEDSARNLWDVQAAIQQIAADFQTAVRAASDFQSYLISIRETGQTVRLPALGMEGGEGGNMSYAGGRVDSSSVPLGVQSEIGMASRIGEMEENATGAGGGAMAARSSSARSMDAGEFVMQMANAGWMASMTGQHGESPETVAAYKQEYRYAMDNRRHPQVLEATFGGQTGTARAFAASRIMSQNLPAAQQFLRGAGIGGVAGALGRLGTYGAVGYAAYQLVDAGMETYAQSRAMAISTNNSEHGIGWGFGQRLGQAGMALSPFVSQEEASQIYGLAVDQGWASRSGGFGQGNFGQALNFMYGARKDYNMDPTMSAQLLQTNVLGAGESVQALAEQLLTLKQTLDGTGVSMAAATGTFTDFTSFLISAGTNPADAARIAGGTIRSFAENTYLGPDTSGAKTVMAALQDTQVQAILGGLTGNLPGAALAGGNADKSMAEMERWVHTQAVQYSSMTGISEQNRVALFRQAYNAFTRQNINQLKAEEIMKEAAADPNFMTRGQKQVASAMTLQHQSRVQSWWHGLDDLSGWAHGQTGHAASLDEQERNTAKINAYDYYSPEVNTLLNNVGDNLQSVVLYGPDGKPVMDNGNRVAGANIAKWFSNQDNYNKFNAANSGYYIQDQSGTKYNAGNIGGGGDTTGAAGGAAGANTVYITLSPQAKMWFDVNKDRLNLSTGQNP